jgi:diaminohydroxyphosphoribosylaminopyrimidine deaminase/5-amino-6-(5-phosphoribosylamino)uracil reductase
MDALLKYLGEKGFQSVLIEGGSQIYTSALEKGLVDKLVLFIAPKLMGGEKAPSFFEGKGSRGPAESLLVEGLQFQRSGCDTMIQGYLPHARPHIGKV